MKSLSTEHPECRTGEICLGNYTGNDYLKIRWKTKRKGIKAYCSDGSSYPFAYEHDVKPVFVLKEELVAAGVSLL